MLKKITLASVAAMALLVIPAQAENTKCQAGKCAGSMMQGQGQGSIQGKGMKGKRCHKMMGRHGSPLLMRLPSPMRMIMRNESDPKLALTADQKSKLEAQRQEMMPKMMKLKDEIRSLSREIRQGLMKGITASDQKAKVEKLGTLKTEATMMKLTCITKVQTILTKDQQTYLREIRKSRMSKMRAKMKNKKSKMGTMKKEMKCQVGKCSGNK